MEKRPLSRLGLEYGQETRSLKISSDRLYLPTQASLVMSSLNPFRQVHRKLPKLFRQVPFLHGDILHSSTSI